MLTDSTVSITWSASALVILQYLAILLVFELIGRAGHLCRSLLCLLEEKVIVDGIDPGLRLNFNVQCAVIILKMHADRIYIAIDCHQGS